MATKDNLLALLARHIGAETGVSAEVLAQLLGINARQVRSLVTELRLEGTEVCACPRTGYHIARSPDEALRSADYLIQRAKKSLLLASRLTGKSLQELAGQMTLPT